MRQIYSKIQSSATKRFRKNIKNGVKGVESSEAVSNLPTLVEMLIQSRENAAGGCVKTLFLKIWTYKLKTEHFKKLKEPYQDSTEFDTTLLSMLD